MPKTISLEKKREQKKRIEEKLKKLDQEVKELEKKEHQSVCMELISEVEEALNHPLTREDLELLKEYKIADVVRKLLDKKKRISREKSVDMEGQLTLDLEDLDE